MSNQLRNVLQRMSYYHSPVSEKRVIEEVLRDCKRERVGLTKEEIAERGYNIFENRNVRVRDLLEEGISKSYVIPTPFEPNNRMLILSDVGRAFLYALHTNNYSVEFQDFEAKVNAIMLSHNELPLNREHIAIAYWEGDTPEEFCAYYLKPSSYQNQTQNYHEFLLSMFGHQIEEDDVIFHFSPKLFVPVNKMGEEVSLEITGVDTPKGLHLSKPYPNKRYHVAGIKTGKIEISSGYYPIIAKRDDFPKELDIKLVWTVGTFKVIHILHITFEFGDHPGNLFSTEQFISRSHNMNEVDVRTFVEKNEDLWRNRKPAFSSKNVFRELTIEEHVVLTNFPIHMHSAFHADKNFRKWLEGKM